jgi:hypothetical protein
VGHTLLDEAREDGEVVVLDEDDGAGFAGHLFGERVGEALVDLVVVVPV